MPDSVISLFFRQWRESELAKPSNRIRAATPEARELCKGGAYNYTEYRIDVT